MRRLRPLVRQAVPAVTDLVVLGWGFRLGPTPCLWGAAGPRGAACFILVFGDWQTFLRPIPDEAKPPRSPDQAAVQFDTRSMAGERARTPHNKSFQLTGALVTRIAATLGNPRANPSLRSGRSRQLNSTLSLAFVAVSATIDFLYSIYVQTEHVVHFQSSQDMGPITDETVDLVVTSPPYPMIEMWDETLAHANPEITSALEAGDGRTAFELMHCELDEVWNESYRVIRPGGFLCINIGDATRKVKDNFRLYSNHSRIVSHCESVGFQSLPLILWRKQTNAPNKFMGSGMLPSGAYPTLEHEYVLVLRKGSKRVFSKSDSMRRRQSAFFWEERNVWFSDVWDLKGVRQVLPSNEARTRSAAYPLELVHRLIGMYSMQGDLVVDPFFGTGTTAAASILNGRNSVGFELLNGFAPIIRENIEVMGRMANSLVAQRLSSHLEFVQEFQNRRGKALGYENETYKFPVMTRQEMNLRLLGVASVEETGNLSFSVDHFTAGLDVATKSADVLTNSAPVESDQLVMSFGS